MINKNYIIHAHHKPEQLKKLVNKLDDTYCHFYIHIDKKSDISLFRTLESKKNLTFIEERVDCLWGDFSQVQATINCIKKILSDNREGYTIFLSGQDYPLKSNHDINKYLSEYSEFEHIDLRPAKDVWPVVYVERTEHYKINLSSTKRDFIVLPYFFSVNLKEKLNILRLIKDITIKKRKLYTSFFNILKKRKCPIHDQFGGSNWWAFKYETLILVNNFIYENESFINFHKYSRCPDELFFQTIIHHLKFKKVNEFKLKDSLTYVNWTRKGCELPVVFERDDLSELISQPEHKLFARKFDMNLCYAILNKIDNSIS